MLRFGPATGPVVIAVLPLFEEANRIRTFMVAILRSLATLGIAAALPDLPGTGESLTPSGQAALSAMQDGYDAMVRHLETSHRPCVGIGIRSAALLDARARLSARWHFAPQSGADLMRELAKTAAAGGNGRHVSERLIAELATARPRESGKQRLRTVRLHSDPRPADIHVDGTPLWRRAEPGTDPALASRLADDIADWVRSCVG